MHWISAVLGALLIAFAVYRVRRIFQDTSNPFLLVEQFEIWRDQARVARRAWRVLGYGAAAWTGITLCSAPKYVVVFLRRFGADVNLVVSRALRGRPGRRFRVVTLNDGLFPPTTVPALERWAVRLLPFALLAGVFFVAGGLIDEFSRSSEYGADLQEEVSLLRGFWIGLLSAISALIFIHLLRIRSNARACITWPGQISAIRNHIGRLQAFRNRALLMAPQSTVVSCASSLWRGAVYDCSQVASVVLVDLSEPTDNICWEMKQLDNLGCLRLFIAESSRIRAWLDDPNPESMALRLRARTLIGDTDVLTYSSAGRRARRKFRRELAKALQSAIATTPEAASRPSHRLRIFSLAAGAVSFLAYATIAFSLAAAAGYVAWRATRLPLFPASVLFGLTSLSDQLLDQFAHHVSGTGFVIVLWMTGLNAVLWPLAPSVGRLVMQRMQLRTQGSVIWRYIVPGVCMSLTVLVDTLYVGQVDFEWSALPALFLPLLPAVLTLRAWWKLMNTAPVEKALGSAMAESSVTPAA